MIKKQQKEEEHPTSRDSRTGRITHQYYLSLEYVWNTWWLSNTCGLAKPS